jgi:hypothetical protein
VSQRRAVTIQFPRSSRVVCPVCRGSASDLESHLVKYHNVADMLAVLKARLRSRSIPQARFNTSARVLAKILANYLLFGVLQVPTVPPGFKTWVLWKASETSSVSS